MKELNCQRAVLVGDKTFKVVIKQIERTENNSYLEIPFEFEHEMSPEELKAIEIIPEGHTVGQHRKLLENFGLRSKTNGKSIGENLLFRGCVILFIAQHKFDLAEKCIKVMTVTSSKKDSLRKKLEAERKRVE